MFTYFVNSILISTFTKKQKLFYEKFRRKK